MVSFGYGAEFDLSFGVLKFFSVRIFFFCYCTSLWDTIAWCCILLVFERLVCQGKCDEEVSEPEVAASVEMLSTSQEFS
jgi:hypothetical protein